MIKALASQTSITSTKFIGESVLAAGCGPFLSVYNWRKSQLLFSIKIFEYNKIHGILHVPENHRRNNETLVVWGGNELSVLCDLENPSVSLCHKLKDRIIDVACYEGVYYVLTSHNEVLVIESNTVRESPVLSEERSILYSGSLFISSNKRLVAAGTVFGGVVVWDLNTQKILHRLQKHEGSVFNVAWNSSGTALASCSDDRAIIVSELDTGDAVIGWGHISRIWKLQFLNDVQLISAAEDCSVRVWNLHSGRLECDQILSGHRGRSVWSLDVLPMSKVAASGGCDGRIVLWDLDKKTSLQKWDTNAEFGARVRSCAVSPCGSVALTTSEGHVFWRLNEQWKLVIDWLSAVVTSKYFENKFYILASNGEGAILDELTGSVESKFSIGKEVVDFFVVSSGKLLIVPILSIKQLAVFACNDNVTVQHLDVLPQAGQATCVAFKNNRLWVGTRKGYLLLYQNGIPSPLTVLSQALGPKSDAITSLQYLVGDRESHIFAASRSSEYGFFEPDSLNRLLKTRSRKRGSIEGSTALNQGHLMWGFQNDRFLVWNSSLGFELLSIDCGGSHRSWDFRASNTDSYFCYVRAAELILQRRYVSTAKFKHPLLQQGTHGREIRGLETCPIHPRLVATGSEDTTVNLGWINDQHKVDNECTITDGHISGIQVLHWSPCGRYLLTGAGQGELVMWQVSTKGYASKVFVNEASRMPSKNTVQQELRVMDFSLHEDLVAVAYSDSSFRIWRLDHSQPKISWKMVLEDKYLECCLLNVELKLWNGELVLLISATNGHMVLYTINRENYDIFRAKTRLILPIHQSSVRSSAIVEYGANILHVSGGDDNSVCVVEISSSLEVIRKLQIPDAHASAVTGVSIQLDDKTFITTGSDQKIRLWSLHGKLIESTYTAVSDTGTLTVNNGLIITGGIGIEMFKYEI